MEYFLHCISTILQIWKSFRYPLENQLEMKCDHLWEMQKFRQLNSLINLIKIAIESMESELNRDSLSFFAAFSQFVLLLESM